MDSIEKNSKSNSKLALRRKGVWRLFSCFNGGLSLSDEETKNRSRGKRHIVVPVENGSGEIEISSAGDAIETERSRHKCLKDNNNKTTSSSTKSQQPLPIQDPSVCHVASKTGSEPAPLCRMLDPVRAKTRSIHHGSREPGPLTRPKHGPSMGLCVLTVALAMLILCGFTYAVIFMSMWFCVLYMFRKDVHLVPDGVPGGTSDQKELEEIDFDSEEYKKMVVLRGFLDRNRRKTLADKIRDGGL